MGEGDAGGARDRVIENRELRREVFARVRMSTVAFGVLVEQSDLKILGSGVVVSDEGIVLTAGHVIDEVECSSHKLRKRNDAVVPAVFLPKPSKKQVQGEGDERETIINFGYSVVPLPPYKYNHEYDLAAMQVQEAAGRSFLTPTFDYDAREGDQVATCGWPYGVRLHEQKTILSSFLVGIVSAVVPHPTVPPEARQHYMMQLPVNPGNSGGPVFDPATGEVYGIVSRRYEPRGMPAGLCVVEPIFRAKNPMTELHEEAQSDDGDEGSASDEDEVPADAAAGEEGN